MPSLNAPRIAFRAGTRRLGAALIALVALAALASPAGAATPSIRPAATPGNVVCTENATSTFDLTASAKRIQTPDGNSIYMWAYGKTGGSFQLPGPVLCVHEGDVVTVNLTNGLSEPTSIVFPGQSNVTSNDPTPGLLAGEADPAGGTVQYTFTADRPGTYLYESGTEPSKQIEMGLYGAIIVRPTLGDGFAYNDASTAFDPQREYILVLHDIDPVLHQKAELGQPFDITTKHDRYWTINGRSFPDTVADNAVPWLPHQPYGALVWVEPYDAVSNPLPALIRYVNAGLSNHPFHPHGNHLRVVGRDGALLKEGASDGSMDAFTKTIGSGQSYDLLFTYDDPEDYSLGNPVQFQGTDVVFPGLLNTVNKDDLTFYSGSPYLGEQDDLMPVVTSLNQCGEFYFPWHSHALNEFQNFNEGFGGLATLLRVDPPGGCVGGASAAATPPAPAPAATTAQAPAVAVAAKVRRRTLSVKALTTNCSPCKAKLRLKVRGSWRASAMRRVRAGQYVAVARKLPKGRLTYYAVATDLDTGRRAVSPKRTVRIGRASRVGGGKVAATSKLFRTSVQDQAAAAAAPQSGVRTNAAGAPAPIGAAALVTFDLCADEGTTTLPGAGAVPIWGFSMSVGGICDLAELPGPALQVEAGDTVTVNLTNNLSEPASLVIPGQTLTLDPGEVAAGSSGTYEFTAAGPGPYLYESGANPSRQHAMGLYGALVVRPVGSPSQAYADPATAYDVERVMVLSELDVQFNNGVAGLGPAVDPGDYDPEYWLINGRPYDPANPAASAIPAAAGQKVLLRFLNAGQEHHTMMLLGRRQRLIARDSFQPFVKPEIMAETIATGSTSDSIVDLTGAVAGQAFPLYSRQLALTNGAAFPGGMLAFITVNP